MRLGSGLGLGLGLGLGSRLGFGFGPLRAAWRCVGWPRARCSVGSTRPRCPPCYSVRVRARVRARVRGRVRGRGRGRVRVRVRVRVGVELVRQALPTLCEAPHTTAWPPGSLCGSSPHCGGVVTPGQSAPQLVLVSGGSHLPSPHRLALTGREAGSFGVTSGAGVLYGWAPSTSACAHDFTLPMTSLSLWPS